MQVKQRDSDSHSDVGYWPLRFLLNLLCNNTGHIHKVLMITEWYFPTQLFTNSENLLPGLSELLGSLPWAEVAMSLVLKKWTKQINKQKKKWKGEELGTQAVYPGPLEEDTSFRLAFNIQAPGLNSAPRGTHWQWTQMEFMVQKAAHRGMTRTLFIQTIAD